MNLCFGEKLSMIKWILHNLKAAQGGRISMFRIVTRCDLSKGFSDILGQCGLLQQRLQHQ